MANKVVFGLKSVYVAFLNVTLGTWGTPAAIPGAVELGLGAEGDSSPFYADDMVYYTSYSNNGYTGDLSMAGVPDATLATMLGWEVDGNGMLVEKSDVEPAPFALLFEVDGDAAAKRYVYYNCTAGRPDEAHKTKGDSTEPETTGLKLTVTPIEIDGVNIVKGGIERTTANAAVFDAFYDAVVMPDLASA